MDSDYQETTYQKRSNGKERTRNSSHSHNRVNRNTYTGSGDLDLHSQGNHTLGPIHARVGGKARISSKGGKMHMAGQKSAKSTSSQKNSEDKFWKSSSNQARYDETLEQSQIFAGSGIDISGAQGVVIDRAREKHSHANGKKNKGKPRTSENIRDDSGLPGQGWMKLQDATFNDVDEAHQTMNFRQQGMTAAAKVVVTLIVIIATSGAGSFLAGGGAAGAGAGGAATAASTSLSIGQAVTQFATQAATSLGFSASMAANIGVGVSAMACAGMAKAVVAGIDNRGNLVNTTKDLATKEQALDLLATGVTAGATRGVSAALKVPTTNLSGLSQHAAYNTVRAGVSTGVNIAMGQKPSDALKGGAASVITGTLGGIAANALSGMRIDAAQAGDSLLDNAIHKAAHGALGFGTGYIGAAITGDDKMQAGLSGATGGLVGEIVGEYLGHRGIQNGTITPETLDSQSDLLVKKSQLAAATAAMLMHQDAGIASHTAQNAVENNALIALPFLAAEELVTLGVGAWRLYRAGEAAKALVNAAPETSEAVAERLSGGSGGGMSPDEDPDDKSKKPVRDMSDGEYVQSLADRADKRFEGKGPRVGTQKHKYAEQVHKRYQRMTSERRHMEAEKRFAKGEHWEQGMDVKGSSRADMYNKRTNEAHDYKFGDAKLSSRQQQKYEANLPRNETGPAKVHEVKPTSSRP